MARTEQVRPLPTHSHCSHGGHACAAARVGCLPLDECTAPVACERVCRTRRESEAPRGGLTLTPPRPRDRTRAGCTGAHARWQGGQGRQ